MALPLTNRRFTQVKLVSNSPRYSATVALDDLGRDVVPKTLLAAEGAAKIARQGKLRDDVYALAVKSSADLVPIAVWADFLDEHPPREQVISSPAFRLILQERTRSRLASVSSRVTNWLDGRGFKSYERGLDSPLITADVPASSLLDLGHVEGVALVQLRHTDIPSGTTWFDAVKGPGARAIVASVEGLSYCNGEGYRPDSLVMLDTVTAFDPSGSTDIHTRWTSELVSATAGIFMAAGASHFIANFRGTASSKYTVWQWCYNQGIRNMNRSATTYAGDVIGASSGILAEDMAQDFYAYNWPFPVITLSAGNCVSTFAPPGELSDCASLPTKSSVGNRSYNTLVVGGSDTLNTGGTGDDTLAGFSQHKNPVTTHGDFELPNLVAPGDDRLTSTRLQSASVTTFYGTSASSPIVLGTVLSMKARDPSFAEWPEMTRATILAASTHPVDGSRTTVLATGLDRKQGAGLLNAAIAVNLADPAVAKDVNNAASPSGRGVRFYTFATDFPGNVSAPYNIAITRNGRLRVVAAWDATAQGCNTMNGSGCAGDVLDGDLDLRVSKFVNGAWQLVCNSATYDSSWELCDLAVSVGETYKAQTAKIATSASGTYLGIAWNNYDPAEE